MPVVLASPPLFLHSSSTPQADEDMGLDNSKHGGSAYVHDDGSKHGANQVAQVAQVKVSQRSSPTLGPAHPVARCTALGHPA